MTSFVGRGFPNWRREVCVDCFVSNSDRFCVRLIVKWYAVVVLAGVEITLIVGASTILNMAYLVVKC